MKPDVMIIYRGIKYKIIENKNVTIKIQSEDGKFWTLHKLTMLDFVFL
jgi:hypothetical protein